MKFQDQEVVFTKVVVAGDVVHNYGGVGCVGAQGLIHSHSTTIVEVGKFVIPGIKLYHWISS